MTLSRRAQKYSESTSGWGLQSRRLGGTLVVVAGLTALSLGCFFDSEEQDPTDPQTNNPQTNNPQTNNPMGDPNCPTLQGEVSGEMEKTCYVAPSGFSVNEGVLTFKPGTTVSFGPQAGMVISGQGAVQAPGTAGEPITFQGVDGGTWGGVSFVSATSASNALENVRILNATGAGFLSTAALSAGANSVVALRDVTIEGGEGTGLRVGSRGLTLENVTVTGTELPVSIDADLLGVLGGGNSFSGNEKDYIEVTGSSVGTAATWGALDVPYRLGRLTIGADVTIEPGAELHFTQDSSMSVNTDGSLNAVGAAGMPITFRGVEPLRGHWQGIEIRSKTSKNELGHVRLMHAGGGEWTGANDSLAALYLLHDCKVTIHDSEFSENAVSPFAVGEGCEISGFENNTIQDNETAGYIHAQHVSEIGAGNTWSGNDSNALIINGEVKTGGTWRKLVDEAGATVPYRIASRHFSHSLRLSGGDIIVDAGAEFEAAQGQRVEVLGTSSLAAEGTETEPVIFRGEDAGVSGFWMGITYGTNKSANKLQNVQLLNAGSGGWHGGERSVAALAVGQPTAGLLAIDNLVIDKSGGYAIYVSEKGTINTCTALQVGSFDPAAPAMETGPIAADRDATHSCVPTDL